MPHELLTTRELDAHPSSTVRRREWLAERCGMFLIAMTVLAALVGLLGPGLLSHRVAFSEEKELSVEYSAMQRYSAPAEFKIRFRTGKTGSGQIKAGISRSFMEHIVLEGIVPTPASMTMDDEQLVMTFDTSGLSSPGMIMLRYRNNAYGSMNGEIVLEEKIRARFSYFTLP